MLYLSLIFTVLLIFAVLILILLSPAATPDFRLKAPCGNKELESAIVDLALKCRFAVKEGTGLPVKSYRARFWKHIPLSGKKERRVIRRKSSNVYFTITTRKFRRCFFQ